jgi:hypothetical protein
MLQNVWASGDTGKLIELPEPLPIVTSPALMEYFLAGAPVRMLK